MFSATLNIKQTKKERKIERKLFWTSKSDLKIDWPQPSAKDI